MRRLVAPVVVTVGLLGLIGCRADTAPPSKTTQPTGTTQPSGSSATASSTPARRDQHGDGSLPASAWPDACTLSGPVPGWKLTDPEGVRGTGPESGVRARECVSKLPGTGTLTLKLLSVSDDVLDDWSAYRFRAGAFRKVDNLGDEAFLTSGGVKDDVLYVCRGRTIFTLEATGVASPDEVHRLLLALGEAAVTRLTGTAAGAPPT